MRYNLTLGGPAINFFAAPFKVGAAGLSYRLAIKVLVRQQQISLSPDFRGDNRFAGGPGLVRRNQRNTLLSFIGLI